MSNFSILEQLARQFCKHTNGCGMAVTTISNGQIVYANAFGPLTLETPLAVASLSKPIFAYALLKLCEQNILNLDTPLTKYLPHPYLADEPYLSLITARHILSHTTGFPNWREETGLRATFPPGSAFHYSTEGLIYLQTVVEHLTRQPLHDYIQHNIFKPFGMRQSQFVPEDLSAFRPFLPQGLRAYGALSLQTTTPDYARFLIQMTRLDEGNDFHLAPALLDEMFRPHIRVGNQPELSWGLGWGLQHENGQEDSFWHWGARRNLTRSFVVGYRRRQVGAIIFTTHEKGLNICEEIAQKALTHPDPFPAFRWLLPSERWRANGVTEQANSFISS